MPVDPTAPVDPFGATVNGTWSLVPEAKLLNVEPDEVPDGTFGVTMGQVLAWVEELTGVVAMTLTGWQRLSDTPVAPEQTSDRAQLIEYARTVIHNGAASYLEAARHPERSKVNSDSYSAVLWKRYTDGLDRLAAWLTKRLADLEAGDTEETLTTGGGAYAFPCPVFLDRFPV
jgi:hypothetical protein